MPDMFNLPQRIFAGTDEVRYIYSAAGEKLAKSYKGTLTYYRANGTMEFTKTGTAAEQLQYIKHEEGQIVKSSSGYTYRYTCGGQVSTLPCTLPILIHIAAITR